MWRKPSAYNFRTIRFHLHVIPILSAAGFCFTSNWVYQHDVVGQINAGPFPTRLESNSKAYFNPTYVDSHINCLLGYIGPMVRVFDMVARADALPTASPWALVKHAAAVRKSAKCESCSARATPPSTLPKRPIRCDMGTMWTIAVGELGVRHPAPILGRMPLVLASNTELGQRLHGPPLAEREAALAEDLLCWLCMSR